MGYHLKRHGLSSVAAITAVVTLVTIVLLAGSAAAANGTVFAVTNLVSDQPGVAQHVDPDLVNAWGLASLPTSPWWVADNGQSVSTLYRADGSKVPLTVGVPDDPRALCPTAGRALPSRAVRTPLRRCSSSRPRTARFSGGTRTSRRNAVVAVPNADGAVYKGLAIASTPRGDRLYATDFHNGRVDAFDGSFTNVTEPGSFRDPLVPGGYAPFAIENVTGRSPSPMPSRTARDRYVPGIRSWSGHVQQ